MSDFPAKITPAVWRALTQNPAFHALVNAEAFAMAEAMSNAWIEEGNAVRISRASSPAASSTTG